MHTRRPAPGAWPLVVLIAALAAAGCGRRRVAGVSDGSDSGQSDAGNGGEAARPVEGDDRAEATGAEPVPPEVGGRGADSEAAESGAVDVPAEARDARDGGDGPLEVGSAAEADGPSEEAGGAIDSAADPVAGSLDAPADWNDAPADWNDAPADPPDEAAPPDACALACGTPAACCNPGELCRYDACVPDLGSCSTDDDCSNDSCCASGVCVPHGVGPCGATDPDCRNIVPVGVFSPVIQCEWSGPPAGDPYPGYRQVLTTPTVVDFNFDGDASTVKPSIVVVGYRSLDGSCGIGSGCPGSSCTPDPGHIRVIDGQTCAQQFVLDEPVNAAAGVALGDLDGDKRADMVAVNASGGLTAFKYDATAGTFVVLWRSHRPDGTPSNPAQSVCTWAGVSLHDLDNDGKPETIFGGIVYDSTGQLIGSDAPAQLLHYSAGSIPVVADVDLDGAPELVTGARIYRFDPALGFVPETYSPAGMTDGFTAVGDFGTFALASGAPDVGYPEIVVVHSGTVTVRTIDGREVFPVTALPNDAGQPVGTGGPPTIGDFDGDGRAEFAVAGASAYAVFDFDCLGSPAPAGCASSGVRWWQPSQDFSSNITGSSIFDFEGDGKVEAVYSDECYTRVYSGTTGAVLFSQFHSSCTWYEMPVVADVDGDLHSELLAVSNENCSTATVCANRAALDPVSGQRVDPIFAGLRCAAAGDCASGVCDSGFCRCAGPADCPAGDFVCAAPSAGTPGSGDVCRARYVTDPDGNGQPGMAGVRVYRDAQDRWVNSRPVWNQHAYAITNVGDTGVIPKTSKWERNWAQPGLNNFRQNKQGSSDPNYAPDLTSSGPAGTCSLGKLALSANICNRGLAPVSAGVPATFYFGDPKAGGTPACTTSTADPLAPGACTTVSCEAAVPLGSVDVYVRADDAGTGTGSIRECLENNNGAYLGQASCGPS